MHKTFVFFLFAFFFLIHPDTSLLQAEPPGDPFQKLSDKVQSIDERMKRVEAAQKEMLERQQKILEEITNLRVWIRQS